MIGEVRGHMDTIGAFIDSLAQNELDRKAFATKYPYPFLVTVEIIEDAIPGSTGPDAGSAATVHGDPAKLRRASVAARDAKVYAIKRRDGSTSAPEEIRLGRSHENDVWVNDAEVSKFHAILRPGKKGLEITDKGSTNGTFLNDKRIETGKATTLANYDSVRLGRAQKMQFLDAEGFYDYIAVLRRFVGL